MAVRNALIPKSAEYTALLNSVQKILVEGQARVEQERVRTYWETGRIIDADILKHKDRADYGKQVIRNLANDLKVDSTVLKRCVRFVRTYKNLPIGAGRHQFKWSHYRELITIADDHKRVLIEKTAAQNDWSAEELALRIKEEKPLRRDALQCVSAKPSIPPKPLPNNKPLTPLRGSLYTYRVIKRKPYAPSAPTDLVIDLGFKVARETEIKLLSGLKEGDIIESRPKNDEYKFYTVDKTVKDLFTYEAYVGKVTDGDTLTVYIDLGFDTWIEEVLRLRGLDCPEAGTKEGDEARMFVQSHLKESDRIIVRSSKAEKYGRYLADVFIPQNEGDDIYLNNLLLETGRAVRM